MLDSLARGAAFAEIVRGFVEREAAPLRAEIFSLREEVAALKAVSPERGEKDERGEAGLQGERGEAGPQGEPGKPGEPGADGQKGEDGKGGEPGEPGAKGDPGEKGEPGKDGADGKDGRDGIDGKDAPPPTDEQVAEAVRRALEPREGERGLIAEQVQRWFETNPVPAGPKGDPGERGEKGDSGERGGDGRDGAAAPVVAGAIKDHEGELVLTLTDGTVLRTGIFDGRPGEKGADGRDGFSLDDFDLEQVDEWTLRLKFIRGDVAETYDIAIPGFVDRGVWKAGDYVKGDGVTWAGSFWIAQRDTSARPETSEDWRLAVKRGRDGKDGAKGEKGETGKDGSPGRDGKGW